MELEKRSILVQIVWQIGESGNKSSKHFNYEAERYSTRNLREVHFYSAQLKAHTESEYHPGQNRER